MEWQKFVTTILIITALNSILYAPNLDSKDKERKELNKERITRLDELMSAEFSPQRLRELLVLLEVPDPEMAFNQARLETGNFSSRAFNDASNCFGMHLPLVRETTSNGHIIADRGRKVAMYNTWVDSVIDYVLYLKYYESLGYDINNYEEFLVDAHYCESKDYVKLLKSMT